MSQVQPTEPDVVEVVGPPQDPAPVVHIDKAEKAQMLFDAKSVIKEQTAQKNETLLTAWANQKQLKRELIHSLGVGDEVVMTDGQILVKERKRNRDLNEDQLVEFMNTPMDTATLLFIAEHKRLPDTFKCSLLEAGYTYREVLVRGPPPKRVKVKKEPNV